MRGRALSTSRAASMRGIWPKAESHGAKMSRVQLPSMCGGLSDAEPSKKSSFPTFGPENCRSHGRASCADARFGPAGARRREPVGSLAVTNFGQLDLSALWTGIGHAGRPAGFGPSHADSIDP